MHSENVGSIIDGGFYTEYGGTINTGGVQLTNTARVTGGMTIYKEGLYVAGGLTTNNRLNLLTDDVVVTAGGGTITLGGYYLTNGDAQVTGGVYTAKHGITVRDKGLSVTGGLTIVSSVLGGGLNIKDEGGTVFSGGLVVTQGFTVRTESMSVTGGTHSLTFSLSHLLTNSLTQVQL
jgi:hypothetical protein